MALDQVLGLREQIAGLDSRLLGGCFLHHVEVFVELEVVVLS